MCTQTTQLFCVETNVMDWKLIINSFEINLLTYFYLHLKVSVINEHWFKILNYSQFSKEYGTENVE